MLSAINNVLGLFIYLFVCWDKICGLKLLQGEKNYVTHNSSLQTIIPRNSRWSELTETACHITINSEDQRAMVYSIDPIGQVAHSNIFGLGPVH